MFMEQEVLIQICLLKITEKGGLFITFVNSVLNLHTNTLTNTKMPLIQKKLFFFFFPTLHFPCVDL